MTGFDVNGVDVVAALPRVNVGDAVGDSDVVSVEKLS